MSTSDIYCASCGASNDLTASACFACGKILVADTDSATPSVHGTLLHNRYLLLNPVGEGGYARVYRAEDTHTRRIVAVKSIGLASLNAQQMIEATDTYNRKLLFGKALKHAHLPAFYDSFTDQDHWYLVVQFIDGPTLETYVEQRPSSSLALWEVLEIGLQLCDVLSYLHTRHPPVIFRDIKPDNIMRDSNGDVYLIDFGIARQFRAGLRRDTHLLGSPGYAAPEQYGSAQTDQRSDIYSLGATLQMLLTGRNPLDDKGNNTASILVPDMAALLARMQAQKPEERPVNAQEVSSALEEIARKLGISQLIPSLQKTRGSGTELWHRGVITPSSLAAQLATYAPLAPSVPPPPTKPKRPLAGRIFAGVVGLVLICLVLAVGIPFWVQSSSALPPQPAAVSNHVLTIGVTGSGDNEVLDPALPLNSQDLQIEDLLYSGLTTVNGQNQLTPGLATSWDAQPDPTSGGLNWTFHLRPNLKFSDGSPLTSADIAYSIDRVFSQPTSEYGYFAQYFRDGNDRLTGKRQTLIGDSLIVPNPSTLIIKEQGRGVFLPSVMSANCFFVVNKALIGKYGAEFTKHLNEGGASGPFMQAGSVNPDELALILNPFYYDQKAYSQKAQISKISVQFFNNIDMERALYKAKRLSIMASSGYDRLTQQEQSDRQVSLVSGIDYLAMNYLTKPFDNIKIRQAFAAALDKVAIMDGAYKAGPLATNHIIPEGQPSYNAIFKGITGLESPQGNAAHAKDLLRQGMQEESIKSIDQFPPVTLTYSAGNIVAANDEMKLIQSQWKNVLGINVKLDNIANDQLNTEINGSANNAHGLQLWFSGWLVDYPDPQNWTTLQFSKGSTWNTMNYGQNTSTDAATQQQVQSNLLKADAMQDPQQRLRAYQKAEQQLVNDVAWLPISQHNMAQIVQPTIHGYQINESGIMTPDIVETMYISQ